MPSSTYKHIVAVIEEVIQAQPSCILDIGIGFGKWGFLFREYLDIYRGRVFPDKWKIKIDGIEIWQPYFDNYTWLNLIYDNLHAGDVYKVIDSYPLYDVITAFDVIEHLPKQKAIDVVRQILRKAKKKVLISLPLGKRWLDNVIVANNDYERHRSVWLQEDMEKYFRKADRIYVAESTKGEIGLFVFDSE